MSTQWLGKHFPSLSLVMIQKEARKEWFSKKKGNTRESCLTIRVTREERGGGESTNYFAAGLFVCTSSKLAEWMN